MLRVKFLSYLLTVISFLLLIIEGEKIAGFVFMYLLWLPFAIINGWSNIFSLHSHKVLTSLIDLIYAMLLYASIFYLLRAYHYKLTSKKSSLFAIASILILQIQAIQFFPKNPTDFFSTILFGFFCITSISSIFLTFLNSEDCKSRP